jgi:tetratricopeptide (TPR) repeat protein
MHKPIRRVAGKRATTLLGKHLREALSHLLDASWLGKKSPLAQPAFLGGRLAADSAQPSTLSRGKALQALLMSSIKSLSEHALERNLLELRYVQLKPVSFVLDACHLSRTTHYRHEQRAFELLETALVRQTVPGIQIHIPKRPDVFVGRANLAATCADELRNGKAIVIAGPIGAGKSTIAAWVAADWDTRCVFWLTLREHLNDNLEALAHTLAYFLLQNGKLDAWLHLSAISGAANQLAQINRFQALVAEGCRSINALIVVDNFDALRPMERVEHARVVNFLAGLVGVSAAIFVGLPEQGLGTMRVDAVHTLSPLHREAVTEWARIRQVSATPEALEAAVKVTDGNAGALGSLLAFAHEEGLERALETAQQSPALSSILWRVFARLGSDEKQFIQQVAVFREPVYFVETSANISALEGLGVIKRTRDQLVYVQPLLRRLIMNEISTERKRLLHKLAARTLTEGAQYTEAMYHLIESGQSVDALAIWVAHRDVEIDQGHATTARELLGRIDVAMLDADALQAWRLCVGELNFFLGELDSAAMEFQLLQSSPNIAVKIFAAQRLARIDLLHRNPESAVGRLTEALLAREVQLGMASTELRRTLATSLTRLRKVDEAWDEILYAECDVLFAKAYILGERTKFDEAVATGRKALEIALQLEGAGLIARAQLELGGTLYAAGRFDEAIDVLNASLAYYTSVGASPRIAECLDTISAALVSSRRSASAIEYASKAYETYKSCGAGEQTISIELTLALAYAQLGDLESSRRYAEQTILRDDKHYLPYALHLLVYVLLRLGDPRSALQNANRALAAAETAQDKHIEARIRLRRSQVMRTLGDDDGANREEAAARAALHAMGQDAEDDL